MENEFVKKYIKEIIEGNISYKEKIPSEQTLMNEFKYSKMTIRKSIEYLKNLDLLYTIKGSGVYVSNKWISEIYKEDENLNTKILGKEYFFSRREVPKTILKQYDVTNNKKSNDWFCYVELLNGTNGLISYSLNWIERNSSDIEKIVQSNLKTKSKVDRLNILINNKIIKIYKSSHISGVSKIDNSFFRKELDTKIVTITTIFVDNKEKIRKISIQKILTQYYINNSNKVVVHFK